MFAQPALFKSLSRNPDDDRLSAGKQSAANRQYLMVVNATYLADMSNLSGAASQEIQHNENRQRDSQGSKKYPAYLAFFIVQHNNPPFFQFGKRFDRGLLIFGPRNRFPSIHFLYFNSCARWQPFHILSSIIVIFINN
jgi:hypothetical protein